MAIDYVNSSKEATLGEGWNQVAEFKTKGKETVKGGVKFEVINRVEQKTSLFKRIAVITATFLTGGLLLISDNARSIVLSGKAIRDFAAPASVIAVEKEITKLEKEKQKIMPRHQAAANKVIKIVAGFAPAVGAAGALLMIGGKEVIRYAAPQIFNEIANLHFGFNEIIAAEAICASVVGVAAGLLYAKTVTLKTAAKIVAVPTVSAAAAIASMVVLSEPKYAVATSLFVGAVMTAQTIFSTFVAKGNERIAELNKKLEVLSA